MSKPQVFIDTLGCRLNQHESETLMQEFISRGFPIGTKAEDSLIRIVNTCTVTKKADNKSLSRVRRLKSIALASDHIEPILTIATGCAASAPEERFSELDVIVVPNDQKLAIPDIVEAHLKGEIHTGLPISRFHATKPEALTHTRASLKIQDGCDNFCTFCIIPHVRGRAISRNHEEICQIAQNYEKEGYHEIVLTGVNMTRYADELGTNFVALVNAILAATTKIRIRLASLEPDSLDEGFVKLFAHERLCPSLHLCIQSGSDKILLAMRRQYSRSSFDALARDLRAIRPDIAISTDVLVGFPGESEADFQASLEAISKNNFAFIHVFTYSKRPLTRADRMPDHLPLEIRETRNAIATKLGNKMSEQYNNSLIGKKTRVVIEGVGKENIGFFAWGMSDWGIQTRVKISGLKELEETNVHLKGKLWNKLIEVEISGANQDILEAEYAL